MWVQFFTCKGLDCSAENLTTYGFPEWLETEDEILDKCETYAQKERNWVLYEEVPCQMGTREQLEKRIRFFKTMDCHRNRRAYDEVRAHLLYALEYIDTAKESDEVYPLLDFHTKWIDDTFDRKHAERLRDAVGDYVRFYFRSDGSRSKDDSEY
jgi:hypothetical protein